VVLNTKKKMKLEGSHKILHNDILLSVVDKNQKFIQLLPRHLESRILMLNLSKIRLQISSMRMIKLCLPQKEHKYLKKITTLVVSMVYVHMA